MEKRSIRREVHDTEQWNLTLGKEFPEFHNIDYIVEKKMASGCDLVIHFKDGKEPISLRDRLPAGCALTPYRGASFYGDICFNDKFLFFPERYTITYDDITKPEGLKLLLKLIRGIERIENGDVRDKTHLWVGACVYK